MQVAEKRKQVDKTGGGYANKKGKFDSSSSKQADFIADKKERKKDRQMRKPHASMIQQAKQIWNDLRQEKLPKEERQKHMEEIMLVITGNVKAVVMRHDAGRVIQCCLKYGTRPQRAVINNELADVSVDLMKQMYSKFLVIKMLKYGSPPERDAIFDKLTGQIKSLIKHIEASNVVEAIYSDYATPLQKKKMVQELYGSEFTLFKDDKPITCEDILEYAADKREKIAKHLFDVLMAVVSKGTFKHSIVHKAMLDFFTIAGEDLRKEFASHIKEHVVEILHTYEGCRVGLYSIWYGSSKDRKALVKSFKGFTMKIAEEEYGQAVLFGIFDNVDDTVIVKNVIVNELKGNIAELVESKFGRKVLLYLMSPRLPAYFHASVISMLKEGDSNPFSKKNTLQRKKELIKGIQESVAQYISQNANKMLTEGLGSQIVEASALNMEGKSRELVLDTVSRVAGGKTGLLRHRIAGMTIKRLLLKETEQEDGEKMFSNMLFEQISGHLDTQIEHPQACYTLAAMFKSQASQEVKKGLCEELNKLILDKIGTKNDKGKDTAQSILRHDLEEYMKDNGIKKSKKKSSKK